MLDLKHLHYAIALAKHRNYARAAEALDMSQPALSRSISGLEKALGVKLFDRTPRGVVPTAFGERLLTRGGALLTDAVELERELKLMQGLEAGVLKVGAGPYPAEMCVGPAVGRLCAKHPRLRVDVDTGGWRAMLQQVLRGTLDLAVIELSVVDPHPRLATEPLPEHVGAFYCRKGHVLLREKTPTLDKVLQFPFACCALTARVAEIFYRSAKVGMVDPDTGDYIPPIKLDTIALAKSVVLTSDAIGLATPQLIAAEIEAGQLVTLPFRPAWLRTKYGFTYLKDRSLAPAALAFMAEVRAVEAELVKWEQRTEQRPARPTLVAPIRAARARAQS